MSSWRTETQGGASLTLGCWMQPRWGKELARVLSGVEIRRFELCRRGDPSADLWRGIATVSASKSFDAYGALLPRGMGQFGRSPPRWPGGRVPGDGTQKGRALCRPSLRWTTCSLSQHFEDAGRRSQVNFALNNEPGLRARVRGREQWRCTHEGADESLMWPWSHY